jgi:hypothetical protein
MLQDGDTVGISDTLLTFDIVTPVDDTRRFEDDPSLFEMASDEMASDVDSDASDVDSDSINSIDEPVARSEADFHLDINDSIDEPVAGWDTDFDLEIIDLIDEPTTIPGFDKNRAAAMESDVELHTMDSIDAPVIDIPVSDANQATAGVIQVDSRGEPAPFEQDELDLLAAEENQISVAVQNARLHKTRMKQREVEQELQFAPNSVGTAHRGFCWLKHCLGRLVGVIRNDRR